MSVRRKGLVALGAVVMGAGTWLAAPAGATAHSPSAPAVLPTILGASYNGTGKATTSNNTNVTFSLDAPGNGGMCKDATSGATLGATCTASINGVVAVKNLGVCIGTGTAIMDFKPSVGAEEIFPGTLTMHHRTGTFTGYFTNIGQIKFGYAHAHFVMQDLPCGGSLQFPHTTHTTAFAGVFQDIHS